MELKFTKTGDITLVEIQKGGAIASPQNPLTLDDLAAAQFPAANGKGLIVSGMPVWAVAAVVSHYKNTFAWLGTLDPRAGGAVVVHSVAEGIKIGQLVPLA